MLELFNTPKLDPIGGILTPTLCHQFRVNFNKCNSELTAEVRELLTMQTVSCHINYKRRIITIDIIQPHVGGLQEAILDIIDSPCFITIETLDGTETITSKINFFDCECINHGHKLDYGESRAASHTLTFSYNEAMFVK